VFVKKDEGGEDIVTINNDDWETHSAVKALNKEVGLEWADVDSAAIQEVQMKRYETMNLDGLSEGAGGDDAATAATSNEKGPNIKVCADATEIADVSAKFITKISNAAIKDHGAFYVAISGGSLPKLIAPGLVEAAEGKTIDFSNWHVFFADERFVPLDHEDNSFRACNEALFSKVPVPASQIYAVDTKLETVEEAAAAYEKQIATVVEVSTADGKPQLDLVMLGMGPDGHTASLFPGHELLQESERLVRSLTDSPKPPSSRVTLTLPAINSAEQIMFVAAGASKASVLPVAVGKPDPKIPASQVRSARGEVLWVVDKPAAADM